MRGMSVTPKTYGALAAKARPAMANQPQTIPWVIYDTQTLTSGTSTVLTFFQAVNADKTLSNMDGPGQLPEPQFLEIVSIGVDVLIAPSFDTNATNVGALNDIAQLLFVQRGTLLVNVQGKVYGPWPLSFFHASGGPTGFAAGTFTATAKLQYANNGVFDGGFPIQQQIILQPRANFFVQLAWAAAPTLNAGNSNIRCWMYGALARAVV